MSLILAIDLGGTKADCALYADGTLVREARIASRSHGALAPLAAAFLAGEKPHGACIAVPGPVMDGEAICATLGWTVRVSDLVPAIGGGRVELLNDLVATAYGVPELPADQLVPIHDVKARPRSTILVIAPGTGLGVGFLSWDGQAWQAHPSEHGHSRFAPTTGDELDLWRFLHDREGFVSLQSVCSGIGIGNIYRWLSARGRGTMDPALAQRIGLTDDITPLVMEGYAQGIERCRLTVEYAVDLLGQTAQDGSLSWLPFGGIVLAGGMPPRILPALRDGRFLRRYLANPEYPHVPGSIPVHVALEPRCALLGATARAKRLVG